MKDQAKEKNRKPIFAGWRPRIGIGCGPIGCSAMVLLAAGVTMLAAMVGCSQKPDPQSTVEAEKAEESAEAIDGHDSQPEESPVVLPEPDHPCDCSPTCPCSKERCLCATGGKCCETCTCQPAKARDWREVYGNGRWWYYHPDKHWSVWDGRAWQRYQPRASGGAGKTNWFGNPKVIRPWRNGLFMGAQTGGMSAGCRT